MKILVTGAAGFIGSKLVSELSKNGHTIVGIDNINTYYNPNLKYARLKHFFCIDIDENWTKIEVTPEAGSNAEDKKLLCPDMPFHQRFGSVLHPSVVFIRMDICDKERLENLFLSEKFDAVINLAAQAGVRYSIKNPLAYVESNIVGFTNILECCRNYNIKHLVYASSSSVYGGNIKTPFSEEDRVDSPVSIYAATKKSNELFANVYSKLYGLPTTGLRFFTVYGPWGRPDMAPMLFSDAICSETPIKVFNNGNLSRDFTYIDDIVKGVIKVLNRQPKGEVPADLFNIGCGHPTQLDTFIEILEQTLGKKAKKKMMPMQLGDVYTTFADTLKLQQEVLYKPEVQLEQGIANFAKWYIEYNKNNNGNDFI